MIRVSRHWSLSYIPCKQANSSMTYYWPLLTSSSHLCKCYRRNDKTPAADPTDKYKIQVANILSSILTYSSLLLYLSHGRAIRLHLQVIEAQLRSQDRHRLYQKCEPTSSSDSSDADDEDLNFVRPDTPDPPTGFTRPFWKTCREWLRLSTSHLMAASALSEHAISNPSPLPIKMYVVVSPQDPALDNQSLPGGISSPIRSFLMY